MAFNPRKIYPIDLIPSKAVGVGLPFNGNAVFKPTFTTKDAIRVNLINFLLTSPGEKVFNTTFGAGIRNYVFQQISTESISEVASYIEAVIQRYFPNIQGTVEVKTTPDYNTVFISITYSIINTGQTDTVQLSLNNG
jgi:phage baseplate assembly protein W